MSCENLHLRQTGLDIYAHRGQKLTVHRVHNSFLWRHLDTTWDRTTLNTASSSSCCASSGLSTSHDASSSGVLRHFPQHYRQKKWQKRQSCHFEETFATRCERWRQNIMKEGNQNCSLSFDWYNKASNSLLYIVHTSSDAARTCRVRRITYTGCRHCHSLKSRTRESNRFVGPYFLCYGCATVCVDSYGVRNTYRYGANRKFVKEQR